MTDTKSGRPTVVDLFAGAGGLSLGFEQAGFDISVAVEFDPIHAAIHELNFPYTRVLCQDVKDLRGDDLRVVSGLGRKTIDVLIGGPPCQGFSLIGHRLLRDPRNELVFHFLRLVTELRPRVFVMENVPGMVSGAHHSLLDELIAGFVESGYRVRRPIKLLNARDYGVPQDRRRLFLLGARAGTHVPDYPPPTTTWLGVDQEAPALPLKMHQGIATPTVFDAIGDLPNIEAYDELLHSDTLRVRLVRGSLYAKRLRGDAIDPHDVSYPRRRPGRLLTGCLRAEHTDRSRARFAATKPGSTEPISRFLRLATDGLCNTLRAGTATDRGAFSAPRPIHPTHPRCISVREAARLHSYPDWFRFHRTIWHGFRQIGNSVPPLLARAVGREVLGALGREPGRPDRELDIRGDELAGLNMREAAAHFGVSRTIIAPRKRIALQGDKARSA